MSRPCGAMFCFGPKSGHPIVECWPRPRTLRNRLALLAFRTHDGRKVFKLVRQRCPTARNTRQHGGSAGRIGWISCEDFVIRGVGSTLFDCGHLRFLIDREERDGHQYSGQHSKHRHRNSEPINLRYRENIAIGDAVGHRNLYAPATWSHAWN